MKMKRAAWRTRKFNESICLITSEDFNLMKKVVINEWMIQRALASPYSRLLNKTPFSCSPVSSFLINISLF
jgi:hypothetical protein